MDSRIPARSCSCFPRKITSGRIERCARATDRRMLAETLHARGRPGEPSDVEELIGAAILEALREADVVGGRRNARRLRRGNDFVAGPKTVKDVWNLIPFENYLVTAELTSGRDQSDDGRSLRQPRSRATCSDSNSRRKDAAFERRITSMRLANGRPLERDKHYCDRFQHLRFTQRRSSFHEIANAARDARRKLHVSSNADARCGDRLLPAAQGGA